MRPKHTSDPYATLAEWYDLEHDAITEDVEFFAQQIAGLGVARPRILEIGSGTGRIAAGLALAGYEVVGIEPSAAMRARCLARLAALPERVARRITVLDGDARLLTLPPDARFAAAIYGLDTFAHLLTADERELALRAAYERLRPGRKLAIDLDPLGPRRLAESIGRDWLQGSWQEERSGQTLRHTLRATDVRDGVVTIQNMLTVTAPDGAITETTTELRLALLSREEVERAISAAGFTIEATSGGYDGREVAPDAPRLLFVAAR
jgi:SAM-dependent methyltransferase